MKNGFLHADISLTLNREDLLDRLSARLEWAKAEDKKNIAVHKKTEEQRVKLWKAACLKAAKFTWEEAKKSHFEIKGPDGGGYYHWRIECPELLESKITHAINQVKVDGLRTYQINPAGKHRHLHYLLTFDPTLKADVCK